ncbi:LysR family transcriptional regulator [Poseidonocella sp. HB161398]|uniref:LysR family transcriptional regulator n=1 Tax=Poseidonocella sp. HB161398 TaxID=2320855 RepID=UPI0011096E9A|nr:LysR family transcriptional regulator [Poseidonocella sp. HB161398]
MALHLVPRPMLYLEAVAEAGSIQAASREIGIAASAIDRQIMLLEERLGVQLFERQKSGMRLSPAGESFLVMARRWRADERRIWSDIQQMQGLELGQVRIGAMDSMANGAVPRVLAALFEQFPRVQVDVEVMTPDDVRAALGEGQIDMALAFNLRPHRDLHVLWSAELPLGCLVAPGHPLAGQAAAGLADVVRHPVALQSRALAIRRMLEAKHGWIFSETRHPVATNSLQLVKTLAASGSHVALTSELDAAPEILDGRLLFLPVSDRGVAPQSASIAVSSRRSLSRLARKVCDLAAAEMEALLAEVRATAAR